VIAHCLDLTPLVDRIGATFDTDRPAGEVNAWGNSYPAEELPFGGRAVVGGVPYLLVPKVPADPPQPDHLEFLGQHLPGPPPARPATAIGLLAAGEMGPQDLSLRVHLRPRADRPRADRSRVDVISTTVPGWMIRPETPVTAAELRCSHLHYPGDYGLGLLVPVLWSRVLPLPDAPSPAMVTAIELVANPLVHAFAVTLLQEEGG
jgi:hypothetical protein